jgi:hypothetical protein
MFSQIRYSISSVTRSVIILRAITVEAAAHAQWVARAVVTRRNILTESMSFSIPSLSAFLVLLFCFEERNPRL